MGSHDQYGKKIMREAIMEEFAQSGPSVEIDYGAGRPARIDGTVANTIAVEIESRTSKQVRGAVLDLLCHPYAKKLLVLIPAHMNDPDTTAAQCTNIFTRYCARSDFRVVVLRGTGDKPDLARDLAKVKSAVEELIA